MWHDQIRNNKTTNLQSQSYNIKTQTQSFKVTKLQILRVSKFQSVPVCRETCSDEKGLGFRFEIAGCSLKDFLDSLEKRVQKMKIIKERFHNGSWLVPHDAVSSASLWRVALGVRASGSRQIASAPTSWLSTKGQSLTRVWIHWTRTKRAKLC